MAGDDQESHPIARVDQDRYPISGDDQDPKDKSRWEKAMVACTFRKQEIATRPILKHFDSDRPPVSVVYNIKWAVSAALLHKHEGVYWSVYFSSRTLKPNEVKNCGMVEKEVLARVRMLDLCYTMLVS